MNFFWEGGVFEALAVGHVLLELGRNYGEAAIPWHKCSLSPFLPPKFNHQYKKCYEWSSVFLLFACEGLKSTIVTIMIQICTPSSLSIAHTLPPPSLLNHNPFLYLSPLLMDTLSLFSKYIYIYSWPLSLSSFSPVNTLIIVIAIASFHTNCQYKKYY